MTVGRLSENIITPSSWAPYHNIMTLMINKHKTAIRVCVNFLSKCRKGNRTYDVGHIYPKHNLWHKHSPAKLAHICTFTAELLRTDYIDAPKKIDRASTTEKINVITSWNTRVPSGQLKSPISVLVSRQK